MNPATAFFPSSGHLSLFIRTGIGALKAPFRTVAFHTPIGYNPPELSLPPRMVLALNQWNGSESVILPLPPAHYQPGNAGPSPAI